MVDQAAAVTATAALLVLATLHQPVLHRAATVVMAEAPVQTMEQVVAVALIQDLEEELDLTEQVLLVVLVAPEEFLLLLVIQLPTPVVAVAGLQHMVVLVALVALVVKVVAEPVDQVLPLRLLPLQIQAVVVVVDMAALVRRVLKEVAVQAVQVLLSFVTRMHLQSLTLVVV
jgi:hypothetical protein